MMCVCVRQTSSSFSSSLLLLLPHSRLCLYQPCLTVYMTNDRQPACDKAVCTCVCATFLSHSPPPAAAAAGHYELDLSMPLHAAIAARLRDESNNSPDGPTWLNLLHDCST